MTETMKFTDSKERVWDLRITVASYRKLQDEGVDIGHLFGDDSWIQKVVGGDMITLPLMLATLTEPQWSDQGCTGDQDFFEGLDGDVLGEATEALLQATLNFIPAHQRSVLKQTLKHLKETTERAAQRLMEQDREIQEMLDLKMESLLDKAIQDLDQPQKSTS